jgi:hypothetical protein
VDNLKRSSQTRGFLGLNRKALPYWIVTVTVSIGVVISGVTGIGGGVFHFVLENELVDKVGHFIFFGSLSFLVHRILRIYLACSTWLVILSGCSIGAFLGLIDEYSQHWIKDRTFDYADLWANCLGVCVVGPFGVLYSRTNEETAETDSKPFQGLPVSRAGSFRKKYPLFLPSFLLGEKNRVHKKRDRGHRRRSSHQRRNARLKHD